MNRSLLPRLSIIVPCFNESEVFMLCLQELNKIMAALVDSKKIAANSYILFVDDGSSDDTWQKITLSATQSTHVQGIKLSRNKGHQLALMAGLNFANKDSDITISIDADLQDDTTAIEKMVDAYLQGYDIVYGVRDSRKSDSRFKRITANTFYKIMQLMGVEQISNHADFRLLSKIALTALLEYKEQNIYIRGLVPLIGFKSFYVYYSRSERAAGESKYPLKKMLGLAIEGITSLTITPLRIITLLGFFICLFSFLFAIYTIILKLTGYTITGWSSMIVAIFFLGGAQMLSLGVIGEYVGKIYLETKKRPKFFIEKVTGNEDPHHKIDSDI